MAQQAFTPHSGAAGSLDLVYANSALKELYDDQMMTNLVYQDKVFLAMLKKKQMVTGAGGKYVPQPMIVAPPSANAADFGSALNNQNPLTAISFFLQRSQQNSVSSMDAETWSASQTSIETFLENARLWIDPTIEECACRINSSLFRSGDGVIGQIQSNAAGVLTLTNLDDVVAFEIGQILVAPTTPTGYYNSIGSEIGVITNSGAAFDFIGYVVAVDRDLGTVSVSATRGGSVATPGGSGAFAAGNYLRTYGDHSVSGTAGNLLPPGLAGWLPKVAPTSGDNFFGVDRSIDKTRLAGIRYDGSSQPIEDAVVNALGRAIREGAKPDTLFLNTSSYAALQKSLGSRSVYIKHEIGDISFSGLQFASPSGTVSVFADRDCLPKTGYLLSMNTWCLWGLGGVPHIDDGDGMMFQRSPITNSYVIRVAAYYTLASNAPGKNAVISLSE